MKSDSVLINEVGSWVGQAYTDLYSKLISQSSNLASSMSLFTTLIGLFFTVGYLKVPD